MNIFLIEICFCAVFVCKHFEKADLKDDFQSALGSLSTLMLINIRRFIDFYS